jgi:hypothetical protein
VNGDLTALVQQRLAELDLSVRAASLRSRGMVNYETLRKIARGLHSGKIADQTAEGLGRALDLPVSKVYEAARAPQPITRWKWPEKFDRLTLPQRRVVEDVAAALLAAHDREVRDGGGRERKP